jgi:hypothetical protein
MIGGYGRGAAGDTGQSSRSIFCTRPEVSTAVVLDQLAWRKISDQRLEQVSVNARVAIVQKLQQLDFEIEILHYGGTSQP